MTMRRRALGVLLALVASVSASACAPARSFFTPPAEHAAYRATIVAPTLDERLAAAFRYLEIFPEGEHEPRVRAYFEAAEPVFFGAKRGSVAGLSAYLRALPRGPHSAQALAELRQGRAVKAEQQEFRGAVAMGARLTRLTAERTRVRTELDAWLRRFLDRASWERPLVDAPGDLIVAWSLALPRPVCAAPEGGQAARRCAKIIELPYTVTVESEPEERQATIEVAVDQDAEGRLVEARIGGPDLFLRLEETFLARGISPDDSAGRASATSRAVDLARNAFEARVSEDPGCRRKPKAPAVLALECGGFELSVRPARGDDEDDVIVIARPAPR